MTDFISLITQNIGYIFFVFIIFFGQKIQLMQMLSTIGSKLRGFDALRKASYTKLLDTLVEHGSPLSKAEIETLTKEMIGSFAIPPVTLDPIGIVPKMEHIFDGHDQYLKDTLREILPAGTEAEIQSLENLTEVAIVTDEIFRVVRHFYIAGKKMGMYFLLQLIMALPMLEGMAKAYASASEAFRKQEVIGDGFGPMVAKRFVPRGAPELDLEPETSLYLADLEDRHLLIIKARGPGGTVGKTGNLVENILRKNYTDFECGDPVLAITIDAALKMEGMETGELGRGVGVAMGGPGMDRFRIEESCADKKIPIHAVVCYMNEKEAITSMMSWKPETREKVMASVDAATKRIVDIIKKKTVAGDTVLVVGVGNTIGVD